MKVKEYIAILLKQDQDAEILIWDGESSYVEPGTGKADVVEVGGIEGMLVDAHPSVKDGLNQREVVVITIA